MIVGFPGETEEDFQASLDLVKRVGFVGLFGFTYSQRPYTPALKLVEDVSEEEKSRRLQRLFELVDSQKVAHLGALVGSEARILIEGRGKTGNFTGRTERNEIVHLNGDDVPTDLCTGDVVDVRIGEAFKNSLSGEFLKVQSAAPEIFRKEGKLGLRVDAGLAPSAHPSSGSNSLGARRSLNVVS
jgi:tRNA-2-methylthio-N6-dimethylallyladenosine synthase